jgi:hypothetical protein
MAAAQRTWAAWPVLRRRVTCFASAAVFLALGPQKYLQYVIAGSRYFWFLKFPQHSRLLPRHVLSQHSRLMLAVN